VTSETKAKVAIMSVLFMGLALFLGEEHYYTSA
jgi:hypothetical protein